MSYISDFKIEIGKKVNATLLQMEITGLMKKTEKKKQKKNNNILYNTSTLK